MTRKVKLCRNTICQHILIGYTYHTSRNKRFYQLTVFHDNTPVLKAKGSEPCLTTYFSEDTKKYGAPGYIKYFSEDAEMVCDRHNPNIVGREKINEGITIMFNEKDYEVSWEPLSGDVSDDFTLGYTIGNFTGKYTKNFDEDGKPIIHIGKYTAIWKKYKGEWKVILVSNN